MSQFPRVGIIGYGKMGREIKEAADAKEITVSKIIDPTIVQFAEPITGATLFDVDVCIEFTSPASVLDNIRVLASIRKNIVVGTTGWQDRIEEVKDIVNASGIGMVYASNFSIGMLLFKRIAEYSAKLFNAYEQYDVAVHEMHHKMKKDAPSGTALTLAETLLSNIDRKKYLLFDTAGTAIPDDALNITSTRLGATPGIHSLIFDSVSDTIELRHTVRNRNGFAEGALLAAQWIHKKQGLFTMQDMLDDIESI